MTNTFGTPPGWYSNQSREEALRQAVYAVDGDGYLTPGEHVAAVLSVASGFQLWLDSGGVGLAVETTLAAYEEATTARLDMVETGDIPTESN